MSAPTGLAALPSFMRLAVVERQLIMQALDLTSLARLGATCGQLGVEALHKEAGKFIFDVPHSGATSIQFHCRAHASPLFRKHAPMSLNFENDLETPAEFEALMAKAASFSRVTTLFLSDNRWWTDDRVLRVLSLPCVQEVRTARLALSTQSLRAQISVFSLPQLQHCDLFVGPTTTLLPSAVALASKLVGLVVDVGYENDAASIRLLRALHRASAVKSMEFGFHTVYITTPALEEMICCLPPTLVDLSLTGGSVPRNLPRPLAKALFSRTPLLGWLSIGGSIATILRGLLDAGLRAPLMLHELLFQSVTPAHFSFDEDSDPIPQLLRRFLHRFVQGTVRIIIDEDEWMDPDQFSAVRLRYAGWPRVAVSGEAEEPIGFARPPSPHASDDEEGSDVDEWVDPHPLTAEEELPH